MRYHGADLEKNKNKKKKMREKRIVFFLLVLFEIYNFLKVEREATIATLSRL